MVDTKFFGIREDGVILNRSYSTDGFKIRKIGTDEVYIDAVDIQGSHFLYEETDEVIEVQDNEGSLDEGV